MYEWLSLSCMHLFNTKTIEEFTWKSLLGQVSQANGLDKSANEISQTLHKPTRSLIVDGTMAASCTSAAVIENVHAYNADCYMCAFQSDSHIYGLHI